MKRVLLLGDSIRMGYQDMVRDLMADEAEVLYDGQDNGRFAAYTLWQANQMFKKYGHFDVVHWNNGYWDMNIESPMTEAIHPIGEYQSYLRRIIALCRAQGAQVIFATTTPILQDGGALDSTGTGGFLQYRNDWVTAYNAAAVEVMAQERVPVDDLYALCLTDRRYYKCEDLLHLTQAGYMACAQQAADCIRALL